MKVEPILIGADNYAYLLFSPGIRACAVVDPTAGGPVAARIGELGLELRWILATHHHGDHIGGIEELAAGSARCAVEVVSSEVDRHRVPAVSRTVRGGDTIDLVGERATVYAVPGHTRGAVAYHVAGCLFTGDTLFLAGCGRLFEGTAGQMYDSLSRLAALPEDTAVYCGHEYTEKNLRFTEALEPGHPSVTTRLDEVRGLRRRGAPTVPGSLAVENRTNPFLRCREPALQRLTGETEPEMVFAALRRRRDRY
jgi:hydroxyacylglutathione hydrolase